MKYTALATLALARFAQAASFNGQGVPASASAIVHVDLETAGESKLVKTFRDIAESAAAAKSNTEVKEESKAMLDAIKAELGLDEKSVKDATVAIFAPATPGGEPEVAMRMRGAFNVAKFESISKNHPDVVVHKSGKHTWYTAADLAKAFKGKPASKSEAACVCMVNDSTLVVTSTEPHLVESVAAAEGKSGYTLDASAKKVFSGATMLAGYFPESFIKAVKPAGAPKAPGAKPEAALKSITFTLDESAGNLNLHSRTRFDSADGAREIQAQAAMMSGMFGMMLGQENPNDTAVQKADKAFAVTAIQAVKFAADGDTFTADFSYSADALAAKLMEKKQDILDGIAKQNQGGSSTSTARPASKRTKRAKPAPVPAAE